jgi:hypothetical protein
MFSLLNVKPYIYYTIFLIPYLCNASGMFIEHGHLMDFGQQQIIELQVLALYDKPRNFIHLFLKLMRIDQGFSYPYVCLN